MASVEFKNNRVTDIVSVDSDSLFVNSLFSYNNISAATTTVVKSGSGILHSICVNIKGTVASTTTVYDNTAASGNKIATIDSLSALGSYLYDVEFSTGLTLVTTGTIAPNITVSYR